MTAIDWIMGGTTVLAFLRQLREKAREHLQRPVGVSLTKDRPKGTARRITELAPRLAFLAWLYYVTDGAAFSPFAFAGDSVWRSALALLGLTS